MYLVTAIIIGAALGILLFQSIGWLRRLAKPRRCSTCKHFDLEEGQAAMRAHPVFMQAAAVLPPSKMGVVVTYDADGTRHEKDHDVPATARWPQFGSCGGASQLDADGSKVLKWGGDVCPDYARGRVDQIPELVQIRKAVRA
jgi:hypothetical protein